MVKDFKLVELLLRGIWTLIPKSSGTETRRSSLRHLWHRLEIQQTLHLSFSGLIRARYLSLLQQAEIEHKWRELGIGHESHSCLTTVLLLCKAAMTASTGSLGERLQVEGKRDGRKKLHFQNQRCLKCCLNSGLNRRTCVALAPFHY